MTKKAEYRAFLQTEFWKELSARKKASVGWRCEKCGSGDYIQSHHVFYPGNWFDTTLDNLQVLCRKCHQIEHGISPFPFIVFRHDVRWSRLIWRVDKLAASAMEGRRLTPRDRRFLALVAAEYPPTPSDRAMVFHVENCLRYDESHS